MGLGDEIGENLSCGLILATLILYILPLLIITYPDMYILKTRMSYH
jgi:hypothetical protein